MWTQYGPALRTPVGPIHWADGETATRWYGYIDGVTRTGGPAATALQLGRQLVRIRQRNVAHLLVFAFPTAWSKPVRSTSG